MKNFILCCLASILIIQKANSQNNGAAIAGGIAALAAVTYLAANADTKAVAKEISQFKSKEYIINEIIGDTTGKEIQFETESLASDNSGGLITVAFNCDAVDKRGLLLAFFGEHRNDYGVLVTAYSFKYLPLKEARDLFIKLDEVKDSNSKYFSGDYDVNNIFVEYEGMKFILYRDSGGEQIRVLWNGFQVIWERVPFDRSKRRLDRWFD